MELTAVHRHRDALKRPRAVMILSATNDAQAVAARPSSPIVFELNAGAHTRARLRDPTDTPRRMDIAEVRSVFGVPDVDSDAPRRRNRSNPREPGPAPGPRPAPACVRHASIARAGTRTPSDKSRQHPRDRLHRVHARDGVPVPATMDASRLAERVGRLNRSVTPCLCVAGRTREYAAFAQGTPRSSDVASPPHDHSHADRDQRAPASATLPEADPCRPARARPLNPGPDRGPNPHSFVR